MYHNLFKQLKLPESNIKSVESLVFSFSGEAVWPIALPTLPVRLGSKQKSVEFIVMDIDSPYNAIHNQEWLRHMKAVAFALH